MAATEFATLAAQLDATVGIVVRPVGAGPEPVTAGERNTGTAWSTIKVPLAVAGLRATDPPEVTEAMRAAVTQSDNEAAESIWQSIGNPPAAALAVQEVLNFSSCQYCSARIFSATVRLLFVSSARYTSPCRHAAMAQQAGEPVVAEHLADARVT